MDFRDAVIEILVTEHSRTREEATALVKRFPNVMVNAMLSGLGTDRAAAFALEMAEDEERKRRL